jgi:hypothetical protein
MRKQMVALLAGAMFMMAAGSALAIPFSYNDRQVPVVNTPGQVPTLQGVLDGALGAGVINARTDQSRVGAWTQSEQSVDAYRLALVSPLGAGDLGIFSLATGAKYDLFTATTTSTGFTKDFSLETNTLTGNTGLYIGNTVVDNNFGKAFGFYWEDSNGLLGTRTSYTLDSMNNGWARALAYEVEAGTSVTTSREPGVSSTTTASGNNDWILAFDNTFQAGITQNWTGWYDNGMDFNDAVFYLEDMNPVPEPGTMMLLGIGMLGMAIYGKRRMNKEA